MTVAETVD
jgi:hypothetical protein